MKKNETNPEAQSLAQQGETFRQMGEYDKAELYFKDAIDKDPNYAWAHAHLGATYRQMFPTGGYPQATDSLKKAIELRNGQYAWAYGQLGDTYFKMQEYNDAVRAFNQAIKLDDQYAWAYAHLGQSHYHLNQLNEAETNLNKAIELNSQYAYAYALRGAVYSRLNRYKEATFDILMAVQLDNTIYTSANANQAFTELTREMGFNN
jgi:tetratricopeptide (TPR) repeat protein